jgi:hypothetical protein
VSTDWNLECIGGKTPTESQLSTKDDPVLEGNASGDEYKLAQKLGRGMEKESEGK